jgi:hypothetical protein
MLYDITKEKKYIFVMSMVTQKTDIMTTETTKRIENQLITLKNNMKFAQHFEVVCKAHMEREYFVFTSFAMNDVKLFTKTLLFAGDLNFRLNSVKYFEEMFQLSFDKKIDNQVWIDVIKSMKYVLKHFNLDDNKTIAYNIADEIFKK